jgi:hypothetical protein
MCVLPVKRIVLVLGKGDGENKMKLEKRCAKCNHFMELFQDEESKKDDKQDEPILWKCTCGFTEALEAEWP